MDIEEICDRLYRGLLRGVDARIKGEIEGHVDLRRFGNRSEFADATTSVAEIYALGSNRQITLSTEQKRVDS